MFNLVLLFLKMTLNIKFTDLCKDIVNHNVLQFGNFTLSNGQQSEYYFDIKQIYSNKKLFNSIVDIMADKIKSCFYDDYKYICGVPYGSLPLTTALSIKLNKPILFIRKEKKKYGNKSQIEGHYYMGDNVLLIEDVISSGDSIENTKNILINNGLLPIGFCVFLNREIGGFNLISEKDFKGMYVFKLSSIITNLVNNNLIDSFENNKYENSTMIQQSTFKNKINKIKENKEYLKNRKFSYNKIQNLIFTLIDDKKTNLCLDLTHIYSWDKCKQIIDICGPYILFLKIDVESIYDFENIKTFCIEIRNLMKKYKFFSINCCNFDLSDLNKLFHSYLLYNQWSNFITIQSSSEKIIFDKINENKEELSIPCLENFKSKDFNYENLEFYDIDKYDDNSPIVLSNEKSVKNRINVYNLDCSDILKIKDIIIKKKYHIITVSKSITDLYNEENTKSIIKQLENISCKSYNYYKEKFNIKTDINLKYGYDHLFKLNDIEIEGRDKEELYGSIRKELDEDQKQINLKYNKLIENEKEFNMKLQSFNKHKYFLYGFICILFKLYYIFHYNS